MSEEETQPSCFPHLGRRQKQLRGRGQKRMPPIPIPIPTPTQGGVGTSVSGVVPPSTKKRIWGITDPFEFPPCEYHRGLLQTVEPLLNVFAPGDLPEFDKFAGNKMKPETLKEAVHVLLANYASTSRLFSRAHTELNIRPRHIALLQNLALLTRPHKYDQASLDFDMYGAMPIVSSAIEAEDDVSGLQIKGGGEKVSRQSCSSNEGLDVDHEAAPEGVDNIKAKGRSDFRAFVWDKAPLKRTELPNFIKERLDLKRLALVFESKWEEEVNACSQAAGYARPGILRNLQNYHVQPIYLLTFALSRWTYAILDVHGSLIIKDNTFTDRDFEAFKEQEKVRLANKGHGGITSAELKARLEFGLKEFRERYQAKPEASFPSQKYLVGNYYECKQWFPLPVTGVRNGLCTDGSNRLYEGLLRVIVGERVLQWTPHDVQSAYDIQLDLHEDLNAIEGLEPTLEQVDRTIKRLQKKRRKLGAVDDLE